MYVVVYSVYNVIRLKDSEVNIGCLQSIEKFVGCFFEVSSIDNKWNILTVFTLN